MTETLPKLPILKDRFVQLYAEKPIVHRVCEQLNIPVSTAYNWLKSRNVQRALAYYRGKTAEKSSLTLGQVMNEAERIAFYDVKQHIKAVADGSESLNGTFLITYKALDQIDGRAIKDIKEKIVDGVPMVEIVPYEKDKFLRILADLLKTQDPDQHLHVHIDPNTLDDKDIHRAAKIYQQLMD